MKEPQDIHDAGNTSDSPTHAPARLSSTGTASPLSSAQDQQDDQAQPQEQATNELQLTVVEGLQIGRGVARIDPIDIARLGCQPGDIVLITGARTTAAKVVPSAMVERGQQTIQMDSKVRQNSASGLGERVTVRKAKVNTAEKITLLPLSGGAPIQES